MTIRKELVDLFEIGDDGKVEWELDPKAGKLGIL